jgi:ribosomal protein S5
LIVDKSAIQCGRVRIVKQLLEDGDNGQFKLRRSAKRAVGYTPLHTAIMSPHDIVTKFEVLMVLLDKAPKGVGILAMEGARKCQ